MSKKDLVEIFGHAPDDTTNAARSLWNLGACPFINKGCSKYNHDQSITYGTCSVTGPKDTEVVICPNRLYANKYQSLRRVAAECYGPSIPLKMYDEYIEQRLSIDECIVALGMNSGKEVKLGQSLSMDWVLAHIQGGKLVDYTGIEVQSIDITGNYRDAWHGYNRLTPGTNDASSVPSSAHGLNWANVHKRLIPQLIRKGVVYSRSSIVTNGLYFILPEIVYQKFEDVIGADIPTVETPGPDRITVHTYELGQPVQAGSIRPLDFKRRTRFLLSDFSDRFISGPSLPSGEALDRAVRSTLGI